MHSNTCFCVCQLILLFIFWFRTKEDCQRACGFPIILPIAPTTKRAPVDICKQPLETGPCKEQIPRWGSKDGECVQFTYGGCGGNINNYGSVC